MKVYLTYVFHWRDGAKHEATATSVSEAFTQLGFGAGALPALDYWEIKND